MLFTALQLAGSFFVLALGGTYTTNLKSDVACTCSSGFVPIPVDVTIPTDPSSPLGLNSTDTFRLRTTFQVYGELCEPVSTNAKLESAIQMLLHGFTYTSQYWNFDANGFQNYSYVSHSCSKGISSFAYDTPGAGRTTRPESSADCQLPTAGNISSSVARELKSGAVSRVLTGKEKIYEKVIAVGHSLGSVTLNYAAIHDGEDSPFDGLILTGYTRSFPPIGTLSVAMSIGVHPASLVDPGRFPDLDPGYVTTANASIRTAFYGPTPLSYSPTVLQLDFLTQDVGTLWMVNQVVFSFGPAVGFQAPVVEMLGSFDGVLCTPPGQPCDRAELQASEEIFYPDSRSFKVILIDGFGHDLNLEYGASEAFSTMNQLVLSFVT